MLHSIVHSLLDEIVNSAVHRCVNPALMEPSVSSSHHYYVEILVLPWWAVTCQSSPSLLSIWCLNMWENVIIETADLSVSVLPMFREVVDATTRRLAVIYHQLVGWILSVHWLFLTLATWLLWSIVLHVITTAMETNCIFSCIAHICL